MNAITDLGLLAVLLLPATSAAQNRTASLAQAQETFTAVDTNKDGKLSPEELAALKLQLTRNDTRGVDFDRDGFWSKDEFLLFYRQRLLAAEVKPAADLEAEATRILAARKAKTTERNAQRPAPQGRPLAEALDELQAKASAGQAAGTDFDRMRDLLVADARSADQLAKGTDPALGENSELQRQLLATIERLRSAALAGQFSREDYLEFRAALVKRARNAAGEPRPAAGDADLQSIEQRLAAALENLEQRATAGGATPEDFQRVRDQYIARARAAAGGNAEPESALQRELFQSLDRLEAAAKQGTFSREEFAQLRDSMIHRAREAAKPAPDEAGIKQAAADLDKRVEAGAVTPADFAKLRGLIEGRLQAASAKTDPASVSDATLYQKLMQSLERLEKAAQNGSVDRQEYQAFKDSFIHRARQIASSSQQSNGAQTSAPATAPAGTQPARDAKARGEKTEKGEKNDKPDPKATPPVRPKPAPVEPEKPPPQQPPHRG